MRYRHPRVGRQGHDRGGGRDPDRAVPGGPRPHQAGGAGRAAGRAQHLQEQQHRPRHCRGRCYPLKDIRFRSTLNII